MWTFCLWSLCSRKAVLFKMSYENAPVIVSSWVTSLGPDNWECKAFCSHPLFLAGWYAQLSLVFLTQPSHWQLYSASSILFRLFWPESQLLLGVLLCSSSARILDLFWIYSGPGKICSLCTVPTLSNPFGFILAGFSELCFHIIFANHNFHPSALWKPWGTSSLPCRLPPISQLPQDVSSQRPRPVLYFEWSALSASGIFEPSKRTMETFPV